ncbi:MAG: ATP-binding protein [Planctomycetota bacterium]|jgi:CO dehydrogenase maturation factor
MATTIAISGKGGSGKTTLSAMIIRLLCSQSQGAILAVDADPNACLGQMLGVQPEETIAEIREQTRQKQPSNEGTDRLRSLEYGIQQAITEAKGFDLLTMGRPEGPSCYCAVNNMLRTFLDKLSSQYQYVIIDNEAGMEHLSRRTTNNVDLLCIVAEPTAVGDLTARRIFELAKQLPISVKETGVIWNRTESNKKLDEIETFGHIPGDKTIFDAAMQGKTIFDLEENSAALSAVRKILESKLNRNFLFS